MVMVILARTWVHFEIACSYIINHIVLEIDELQRAYPSRFVPLGKGSPKARVYTYLFHLEMRLLYFMLRLIF